MSIDLGSNPKRDEKMIKFDNYSKIEIFKFESNFQVEIHKKSNKSNKSSAAARLAAAAHASPNFLDVFPIFEHERT